MKKYNIFKILSIVIILTMLLSYFIPGTMMGYTGLEKGTIMPVTFTGVFMNGVTSINALLTTIVYVLAIGIFYAVLNKTERYETLVENTAATFEKNKSLFVVITVICLGLVSLFAGDFMPMLIFVPFLMAVLRKIGYSKFSAISATIGSMILGFSGSLYTNFINQYLSLTVKDSITVKITLALVGLVSLIAFILIFNRKPSKNVEIRKSTKKKMLPLYITFILVFVLMILGFVNWQGYFGFTGFEDLLTNIREAKVSDVSIFDAVVGNAAVAFGAWQAYHSAMLLIFISLIIGIIYKIRINDFVESIESGLKKALPFAGIVVLANVVLVNVYSSGIFYTMAIALTEKTIDIFSSSISGILASIFYPDYSYATQFTLSAIMNTQAKDYAALLAVVFQAIYSLFLLVSPTSILVLFALRLTETRYIEWIKYIIKYFLVLLLADLLVIAIFMNGFTTNTIIFMIAIVVLFAFVLVLTKKNKKSVSESKKAESKKEEVKKVEVKEEKKSTEKKSSKKSAKKATKKGSKK